MKTMAALVTALVVLASAGCIHPYSQPYVSPSRLERGLVIVLTGIEGRSTFNEAICKGLAEGGVNYAIELQDWTAGFGPTAPLYNLMAENRNHRKAGDLADRVIDYLYDYPGRPVYLVGQSGGGAMAAWVAEALPPGYSVDGIIMLDVSLSPGYVLDTALKRSSQGIVSFYSQRDIVLLGLGTTIVGTMDGKHSSSAGRQGFEVPSLGARAALYRRLFQVAWQPSMASSGHSGLHLTSGAEGFVSQYVAPFVRSGHWDADLVTRVLNQEPIISSPVRRSAVPFAVGDSGGAAASQSKAATGSAADSAQVSRPASSMPPGTGTAPAMKSLMPIQ